MSAYMVSKTHIDALVRVALYGPRDVAVSPGSWHRPYVMLGSPGVYPGARFRSPALRPLDIEDADWLGELLIAQNLRSIHARYPDTITNPDATPGPVRRYWEDPYQFTATHRLSPVEALKAIDCYEYQSCEDEGWESSAVHDFCTRLRNSLVSTLPGYREARWEVA